MWRRHLAPTRCFIYVRFCSHIPLSIRLAHKPRSTRRDTAVLDQANDTHPSPRVRRDSPHANTSGTPSSVGTRIATATTTTTTTTTSTTTTAAADVAAAVSAVSAVPLSPHDPAAVVTLDTRARRLHLRPDQRALLWSARRRQYQQFLLRLVTCLGSHLTPIEKCHTLLALHEEAVAQRLRLRADTYEDIFHTFYATVTLGDAAPALAEEEEVGRGVPSCRLCPPEFASPSLASHALLSAPILQSLWAMYRYMIDSGTNPTARVVQHVMGILDRCGLRRRGGRDALVESKAHALVMDLDRFHLTPTAYTIASYIGVCDANGVMHLAVARVTDYRTRHEQQASPGIQARLIFGLLHNGQYDEALACVAALDSTALTSHLLNATLDAARRSRDPLSAFALYRSVAGRGVAPTRHTISILLEAMRAAERYEEVDFLLSEMRRYRVRGGGQVLNRLLGVLLQLRRNTEAAALAEAMERKGTLVFDELRRQLHSLQKQQQQE